MTIPLFYKLANEINKIKSDVISVNNLFMLFPIRNGELKKYNMKGFGYLVLQFNGNVHILCGFLALFGIVA